MTPSAIGVPRHVLRHCWTVGTYDQRSRAHHAPGFEPTNLQHVNHCIEPSVTHWYSRVEHGLYRVRYCCYCSLCCLHVVFTFNLFSSLSATKNDSDFKLLVLRTSAKVFPRRSSNAFKIPTLTLRAFLQCNQPYITSQLN